MKNKGLSKLIFKDWQQFKNERRKNVLDEIKDNSEKYKNNALYRQEISKIIEEKFSSEGNFKW